MARSHRNEDQKDASVSMGPPYGLAVFCLSFRTSAFRVSRLFYNIDVNCLTFRRGPEDVEETSWV